MLSKVNTIYELLVVNKQKAVVGFVVGAVVTYAAKYGLDLNTLTVSEALELVVGGAVVAVGVYLKKNQ